MKKILSFSLVLGLSLAWLSPVLQAKINKNETPAPNAFYPPPPGGPLEMPAPNGLYLPDRAYPYPGPPGYPPGHYDPYYNYPYPDPYYLNQPYRSPDGSTIYLPEN